MTIGAEIKKELKAAGIKALCRTHHGSAYVSVIEGDLRIAKKIAKQWEHISYDHATGCILRGGNTFVFVDYHRDTVAKVVSKIKESVDLETMAEGITVRLGDFRIYEDRGFCQIGPGPSLFIEHKSGEYRNVLKSGANRALAHFALMMGAV